jgi:hypothetical protein
LRRRGESTAPAAPTRCPERGLLDGDRAERSRDTSRTSTRRISAGGPVPLPASRTASTTVVRRTPGAVASRLHLLRTRAS